MVERLMYPVALDACGRVVTVEQAVRGEKYYCPQCTEPFVLRAGQ